ncbi:MAG: hypothetical protein ACK4F5_14950 [Aliihoeflea sp.]
MQTNEPMITITGLAVSGPVNVYPESAGEAFLAEMEALSADLPEGATPAQREARMEAIMASYEKLAGSGSTADAADLTHLQVSADGRHLEPVRAKSMAHMASQFWAKHGARQVDEGDDIDRSVAGHGPGYEVLARVLDAKPRPRGR